MDVNEQIAKAFFEEVHSYLVKTNHYFKKIRKKGVGPSDIDLVLRYSKDNEQGIFGKKAICSVKGWQSFKIKLTDIKDEKKFKKDWKIFEEDELKAAEYFFGDNNFNKVLILPPIDRNEIEDAKKYCMNKYGIILLDFSEVLIDLLRYLASNNNVNRSYDLEVLQTLRIVSINILQIKDKEIQLQNNLIHFLKINKDNFEAKMYNGKIKIKNKNENNT